MRLIRFACWALLPAVAVLAFFALLSGLLSATWLTGVSYTTVTPAEGTTFDLHIYADQGAQLSAWTYTNEGKITPLSTGVTCDAIESEYAMVQRDRQGNANIAAFHLLPTNPLCADRPPSDNN